MWIRRKIRIAPEYCENEECDDDTIRIDDERIRMEGGTTKK